MHNRPVRSAERSMDVHEVNQQSTFNTEVTVTVRSGHVTEGGRKNDCVMTDTLVTESTPIHHVSPVHATIYHARENDTVD